MSTKVIQPELFIKYLPEDLVRYTYSFVYCDVKVCLWRYKYNFYDILNNLYNYWGRYHGYNFFADNIVDAFAQYFPNELHRVTCYFKLERERVKGGGWIKWYEIPYEADDLYYADLFNDIIAIIDEKSPNDVYGLLAGWVLMNNQILSIDKIR